MFAVNDKNGKRVGESTQFLTFEMNLAERCLKLALNIQKIKEVVEYHHLDPVPDARRCFLGILDLRGTPVSILSIDAIINKESQPATISIRQPSRIVICDLQGMWIGIPVLSTGRIMTCSSSDFQPPPAVMVGTEQVFFSGVIKREGGFISVFDIDGILHSIGIGADLKSDTADVNYKGKRVLVVEDSRAIRLKLIKFFESIGFTVFSAQNGSEGLAAAAAENYRFDLVFTDIEMPILDGIAMARTIRQTPQGSRIPIIFNSALSNPHLIHDVTNEGLGTYVVKFNVGAILNAIGQVLPSQPQKGQSVA